MRFNKFLIGVIAGAFIGSVVAPSILAKKKKLSPENVLKQVKNQLENKGKIIGSWIYMQPETYEKNSLSYQVYQGGITISDKEKNIFHLQFVADTKTGVIIDLFNQNE